MSSDTRMTGAKAQGPDGTAKTDLPFRVEQWKDGFLKRILGLAAKASLGWAIYIAAKSDYPEDMILLCQGNDIIARSDKEGA